ncbi:MAG TPA: lipocalin family protein [Chitinophagaceae bacterium]
MKALYSLLVVFATVTLFSSCGKDGGDSPSKNELIVRSSWKFDKAMYGVLDVSSAVDDCLKDNIITFVTGGTGTMDEGLTKCNTGDPQTVNFTWSINDNTLSVTGNIIAGQSGNFTIITLNSSQLVLEGTVSTPAGNVTGQVYFKH